MKVLLTIAAILLTALSSAALAAQPLPDLVVPDGFGLNIHFRHDPPDLDMITDAGFKFIRMDFSWSAIEKTRGVYDFEKTGYDALTAGCIRRGIRILYILDYSNNLYEAERSVQTEAGRKAFAAFAAAAAKRYAGKGILWEIWNEPNIKQFWVPQPSEADYCALVAETAPAVRAADPSGLLVAGATSTIPFQWFENCFKKGMLAHIDVLSVHPYRPKPPETVIDDYDRLRRLISEYSPDRSIPIISGEWGYSNINWDKTPLTDDQQAQYLVRELLINLHQQIPVSIWYDWKNDGTNPEEREHNFGIVENDLKPKTAYNAARTLNTTLAGYRFTKRIPSPDSDHDFALQFEKDGARALALWTTEKDHKTTLTLPAGHGELVDMLGKSKQITWDASGPNLTLSRNPQYLLIKPRPNVAPLSAACLSTPGPDDAAAVDIAPDRSIVFAGTLAEIETANAATLIAPGKGVIIRLDSAGRKILSRTLLGASVDDMEIDQSTGNIAAIGDFGAALLAPDASRLIFHNKLDPPGGKAVTGPGRRIAAAGGIVAALHGKTVTTFDPSGKQTGQWTLSNSYVEDIAVDAASSTVILCGFDNKRLSQNNRGAPGGPVQVAFMFGFDPHGNRKWTNYNWKGSDCDNGNEADSRGLRLAMGRDGKLYFGAESAGGNSIFRWNPRKLGELNQAKGDKFNVPYNTAANHISYYARFEPATGNLIKGQFILTRKDSGKGNAVRMHSIAADQAGNIYVAGIAAYAMDTVSLPTVAGQQVCPAGGHLLVIAPDFSARRLWTTFETDSYASTVRSVAASAGRAVIASNVVKPAMITTGAPATHTSTATKENPDAYLAVIEVK